MDPLLKDWITVGFSSAALIVSCASFYLSLRNFRRDRGHLKLSIDFGTKGNDLGAVYDGYILTITNDGRRPVIFSAVYANFWFRNSESVYAKKTTLQEGEAKTILVAIPGFFIGISHPLAVRKLTVKDSIGNVYRINTIRLFWKIRKLWKPETE